MKIGLGRIILRQNDSHSPIAERKRLFCHKIILPLFLLILSGCKNLTGGAPDWVANPKAAYPENQYLVAVGEGDTRRAAENAADANLSRIFESNIESDERMVDQTRETNKAFERTTDFTADINILSSQTLFNIQHAEAWHDRNGRVHAVAYLDRRETAAIYRGRIDDLAACVHFLLAQAGQAADPLKKYAALRAAARTAAENDLLLRQLKIIHPPSVASATPGYSNNTIRKALADTAQQIRVQIQINGDDERRMAAVLEELITRYGFVVGTPALLDITGRIAVSDTGQRTAGLVFVRYELSAQIKDATGTVLAAINNKGREGHVSLEEARVRSFRTLETAIKATGAQRLDAYFDSLVDQTPQ